jgi:NAD(P)-dependent dehydrogenase (short-subunit alcohol dehydrogenase family)
MNQDFTGLVAIVTGGASGIGAAIAERLRNGGARVAVFDLRPDTAPQADLAVAVDVADDASVRAGVERVVAEFGRIDIVVNNAGILRDKSFAKMEIDDFKLVVDVHLMGAVNCTKAVWETMRAQNYGRIVMTTSSSGLFGNFGQANYGAAKMALVGLMQTLSIEGAKHDIRVNCLAPTAATRMTEKLMPEAVLRQLEAGAVTPGLLALVADDAPTRAILCAEQIALRFDAISDRTNETVPESGAAQGTLEVAKAMRANG